VDGPAVRDQTHPVSVYGRISGHLIHAREVALAHRTANLLERLTLDALVIQIDALILVVRRLHHHDHLN
jgi:hypothetical protein